MSPFGWQLVSGKWDLLYRGVQGRDSIFFCTGLTVLSGKMAIFKQEEEVRAVP